MKRTFFFKKLVRYFGIFFLLFVTLNLHAEKRNVLFIGNSYTNYNGGLPTIAANIASSLGDTLIHESSTPGGFTAQQHSTHPATLNKISQGNWDYVSLQFQSQQSALSPSYVASNVYPFAKRLDSIIQATNPCAESLFFMTWGRKNGDASLCATYPDVCTYDGMQQRLRESYLLYADSLEASVSPVGAAWNVMRDSFPSIELYNPDESHPSMNGTYLAACVFYCTLYKQSCVGSMYLPNGVGNGDALIMQKIASNLVLDSLENWQSEGGIPDADFIYSVPTISYQISFLNDSKRYSSSRWNFGDGSPINTSTSPNHTFPNAGPFTVCLEAISACGKIDAQCQSVLAGPTSTSNFSTTDKIKIQQTGSTISIQNELSNCRYTLLDINGVRMLDRHLPNYTSTFSLRHFAKGIYFLKIKRGSQLLKLRKLANF